MDVRDTESNVHYSLDSYSHIPNMHTSDLAYIYVYLFSENLQPYTTLFGSIRLLDL